MSQHLISTFRSGVDRATTHASSPPQISHPSFNQAIQVTHSVSGSKFEMKSTAVMAIGSKWIDRFFASTLRYRNYGFIKVSLSKATVYVKIQAIMDLHAHSLLSVFAIKPRYHQLALMFRESFTSSITKRFVLTET